MERELPALNRRGYRVAFVIEDKTSLLWKLLNAMIASCTLGFYWRTTGVLIIGERMEHH